MKWRERKSERALTRIEVLVIVCMLTILVVMLFPLLFNVKSKAVRTGCVTNLRQIGLSFRQWSTDQSPEYPIQVTTNHGGTLEFSYTSQAFRHFQALSNELNTTKVLTCPRDVRIPATNFAVMQNSNVSYFVGLDAKDEVPSAFLAGDRNLTNGTLLPNGILELTPESVTGWTTEMHNKKGNVGLADGSVMSWNDAQLRADLVNFGIPTNRLAMPVE